MLLVLFTDFLLFLLPLALTLFTSKISDLKEKKVLLFVRHGLVFDESQKEITLNFNITDGKKGRELEDYKGD